jgi:hypothetical protein
LTMRPFVAATPEVERERLPGHGHGGAAMLLPLSPRLLRAAVYANEEER